jgi:hypothetical protein
MKKSDNFAHHYTQIDYSSWTNCFQVQELL